MVQKGKPASFGDFTSGILDDIDARIKEAAFEMWDYGGKGPEEVPALRVVFEVDGEEQTQMFKTGNEADWRPNEDGDMLMSISGKGLNKGAKGVVFFKHLVDCGFPEDKLQPLKASAINGTYGHFILIPHKSPKENDTVLVCDKVYEFPWEKKEDKKSSGKKKTTKKAESEDTGDDNGEGGDGGEGEADPIVEKAENAIMAVLGAEGGSIAVTRLPTKLWASMDSGDKDRKKIFGMANQPDFYKDTDRPWEFDGKAKEISMPG